MTDRNDVKDLLEHLEQEYPERHALDTQPDWIGDLTNAHSSIELAYVRKRGPSPELKVELKVLNTMSDEDGWHRIEATERVWFYPHEHPPAGVSTALRWLRENVPVAEFRDWFEQQ